MKRSASEVEEMTDFGGISLATVANYLMLLSQAQQQQDPSAASTSPVMHFDSSCPPISSDQSKAPVTHNNNNIQQHHHHQPHQRVFECKTCNRRFPSFQALGGHRASHKKPRLQDAGSQHSSDGSVSNPDHNTPAPKPKTHECSICGLEFPIGQALGGHMRRHRALYGDGGVLPPPPAPLSPSLKLAAGAHAPAPAVTKKPSSEMFRRTSSGGALCLDLNLTPLENGLDQIGKTAPIFG